MSLSFPFAALRTDLPVIDEHSVVDSTINVATTCNWCKYCSKSLFA